MVDLTWKIFSQTGNLETYLLMKEIERERQETAKKDFNELVEIESPLS
ncbi:YqzL family protein [Calidifontibacillus oryziterrae]|nr:YqzL family protein [Calidifontibacillus oryziterrae]